MSTTNNRNVTTTTTTTTRTTISPTLFWVFVAIIGILSIIAIGLAAWALSRCSSLESKIERQALTFDKWRKKYDFSRIEIKKTVPVASTTIAPIDLERDISISRTTSLLDI